MEEQFIRLLQSTGRNGMDAVTDYLRKSGFFIAPASVKRHLAYDGGLAEHSMNVYNVAMMLYGDLTRVAPDAVKDINEDNVTIAALLHDICKANIYKKILKWRKDETNNKWERYEAYEADYSRFPIGHGEKSVIMLLRLGLELTNDEIIAIRWHMGAWDLAQTYEAMNNISEGNGHPLTAILQAADTLATHIIEKKRYKATTRQRDNHIGAQRVRQMGRADSGGLPHRQGILYNGEGLAHRSSRHRHHRHIL